MFSDSDNAATYACQYVGKTTTVVAQRIGDKNIGRRSDENGEEA
jgi:hypothetical protein